MKPTRALPSGVRWFFVISSPFFIFALFRSSIPLLFLFLGLYLPFRSMSLFLGFYSSSRFSPSSSLSIPVPRRESVPFYVAWCEPAARIPRKPPIFYFCLNIRTQILTFVNRLEYQQDGWIKLAIFDFRVNKICTALKFVITLHSQNGNDNAASEPQGKRESDLRDAREH